MFWLMGFSIAEKWGYLITIFLGLLSKLRSSCLIPPYPSIKTSPHQSKRNNIHKYRNLQPMNLTAQINYYLKVAIDVNRKVGGTRAYQAEANNRDRFIVIRDNIYKNFHFIRTKLEERQRRKGHDASNINTEIREKIEEIYNQLERMREAVASEKGANPAAQTVKYDLIEKLTQQARELQEILDSSSDLDKKLANRGKNETYTDMREQLLEGGKPKQGNRIQSKQARPDATELQLTKMKEWRKVDEEIDREIDNVIDGIKKWKEGLNMTGDLIKQTDDKISKLTTQVDKVNDDLFRSNKQLKGIVEKFRKPHKFCIDVVLALILIALVVGIVKLSS